MSPETLYYFYSLRAFCSIAILHRSVLSAGTYAPCWYNKAHTELQERKKWLQVLKD